MSLGFCLKIRDVEVKPRSSNGEKIACFLKYFPKYKLLIPKVNLSRAPLFSENLLAGVKTKSHILEHASFRYALKPKHKNNVFIGTYFSVCISFLTKDFPAFVFSKISIFFNCISHAYCDRFL